MFFYSCFLEGFFYHKWMLNFVKGSLCIYWYNPMIFIFQFVNVMYYIDWFADTEEWPLSLSLLLLFASSSRGFRLRFYLIPYNLAILTFWNSKIVFLQINEDYSCSLQLLFLNWAKFIYSSCLFTCKIDIPFTWSTMRIKYLTLKGYSKNCSEKSNLSFRYVYVLK